MWGVVVYTEKGEVVLPRGEPKHPLRTSAEKIRGLARRTPIKGGQATLDSVRRKSEGRGHHE